MSEIEVFPGKNLSDLFKDVFETTVQKRHQINEFILHLQTLVKGSTDAMIIVPIIKDYLDVGIKNEDLIIKIAGIVQRLATGKAQATEGGSEYILSEEEKKQLLSEATALIDGMKSQGRQMKQLQKLNSGSIDVKK